MPPPLRPPSSPRSPPPPMTLLVPAQQPRCSAAWTSQSWLWAWACSSCTCSLTTMGLARGQWPGSTERGPGVRIRVGGSAGTAGGAALTAGAGTASSLAGSPARRSWDTPPSDTSRWATCLDGACIAPARLMHPVSAAAHALFGAPGAAAPFRTAACSAHLQYGLPGWCCRLGLPEWSKCCLLSWIWV